jgi:hypothetical protein
MKTSSILNRGLLVALAACGIAVLGLSGCKPKPTHEIGKVEYDKLVDWRELAKLGPQGCRKFLGQTLTFTELKSHGKRQKDEARQNVCKQDFSATKQGFDWDQPEKDVDGMGIGVYINFGPELAEWLPHAANDTFLTLPEVFTVNPPLVIQDDICGKCKGRSHWNPDRKEYMPGQPVEECFLESPALHITGRVIGINWNKLADMNDTRTSKAMMLLIQPTGMSW